MAELSQELCDICGNIPSSPEGLTKVETSTCPFAIHMICTTCPNSGDCLCTQVLPDDILLELFEKAKNVRQVMETETTDEAIIVAHKDYSQFLLRYKITGNRTMFSLQVAEKLVLDSHLNDPLPEYLAHVVTKDNKQLSTLSIDELYNIIACDYCGSYYYDFPKSSETDPIGTIGHNGFNHNKCLDCTNKICNCICYQEVPDEVKQEVLNLSKSMKNLFICAVKNKLNAFQIQTILSSNLDSTR